MKTAHIRLCPIRRVVSLYAVDTLRTASLLCMVGRHASFGLDGCRLAFLIHQALGLHCYYLERSKHLPNCLHCTICLRRFSKAAGSDSHSGEHEIPTRGRTYSAHGKAMVGHDPYEHEATSVKTQQDANSCRSIWSLIEQ